MLTSTTNKVQYSITYPFGSTYAIPFKYWVKSELVAVLSFDDGTADQTLLLDTDYSLTDPGDTGTLTKLTDWDHDAVRLTIYRELDNEQPTDYRNGEAVDMNQIEQDFDRSAARDQQLQEQISRQLVAPITDPVVDMTIPTQAERANTFAAYGASGEPIAAEGMTGAPVTSAWADVLDEATIADGLAVMGSALDAYIDALIDPHVPADTEGHYTATSLANILREIGRKLQLEDTLLDEVADATVDVDPTTVSATAELIEANDIACLSQLGRFPAEEGLYKKNVVWEPPYLGTIDMSATQSPWASALPRTKWANRGAVGVFPATTNLWPDTDAPGSTWTDIQTSHLVVWDSVLKIPMTKVSKTVSATADYLVYGQPSGTFSTSTPAVQCILKKGTAGTRSCLYLYDSSGAAVRMAIEVTWDTHSVSLAVGTSGTLTYHWLDTDTIWIAAQATGVVTTNTNQIRIYPDNLAAGSSGDHCFVARIMAENNTIPTAYTSSGRTADLLKYNWPIPAAGTIAFWFRPTGYGGSNHPTDGEIVCLTEYARSGANWYTNNLLDLKWDASTANQVRLRVVTGTGTIYANTDNTWSLTPDTWYHIALTWSGLGGASGAVTVYLNGVAKANLTMTGLGLANFAAGATTKLIFGSDGGENTPAAPTAQANGLFTDILLDSTAWSAADLLAHVTANKPWLNPKRMIGPRGAFKLDGFGNLVARRLFNEQGEAATLIESGENANGKFLKFSDGTLICTAGRTSSAGTYATWTFPHAFASNPIAVGTMNAGESQSTILTIGTISTTSYRFALIVSNTASYFGGTGACGLSAFGRWKA